MAEANITNTSPVNSLTTDDGQFWSQVPTVSGDVVMAAGSGFFTTVASLSDVILPTTLPNQEVMTCPEPMRPGSGFDTVAYGFFYPVLAIVVIFTNCNGIAIILKMANFTQTNILLLSIFLVDLLTTVLPLPKFLYTFSINMNEPLLPIYPWCFIKNLISPILPTVTNNISIWLVSLLSIQRCVCVRNRDLYERWFSQSRIVLSIIVISVLTLAFHLVLLVDNIRFPVSCLLNQTGDPDLMDTSGTLTICNMDAATFIIPDDTPVQTYILSTYYIMRVLLFHVIPIIAISTSTALLMFVLFKAQSRIERLSRHAQTKAGAPGSQPPPGEITNAQMIKNELDRIEESEYRNASVNLSERRRRSMGIHIRRHSKATAPSPANSKEKKNVIPPALQKTLTPAMTPANINVPSTSGKAVQKQKRVATTTHMLVIISTIYLIQHTFQSALFVTGLALNFTDSHTETSSMALTMSATVGNLAYVAGFPAAFLLCISVQEPFREMFYSIYEDNQFANWLQKRKQASEQQRLSAAAHLGSVSSPTPETVNLLNNQQDLALVVKQGSKTIVINSDEEKEV